MGRRTGALLVSLLLLLTLAVSASAAAVKMTVGGRIWRESGEVNYDGTLSGDLSDGTAVLTLKNLPASVLTGSDSSKALAVTCSIKMDTILLGDITTSAKMSIWVER